MVGEFFFFFDSLIFDYLLFFFFFFVESLSAGAESASAVGYVCLSFVLTQLSVCRCTLDVGDDKIVDCELKIEKKEKSSSRRTGGRRVGERST